MNVKVFLKIKQIYVSIVLQPNTDIRQLFMGFFFEYLNYTELHKYIRKTKLGNVIRNTFVDKKLDEQLGTHKLSHTIRKKTIIHTQLEKLNYTQIIRSKHLEKHNIAHTHTQLDTKC